MLVFIIPLKSAKVSNSWQLISRLLERTIRSICNQTTSEFNILVVCHEKPDITFSHSCLHYLEVDFPPPSIDLRSKQLDQARKMLTGLMQAQDFNPSYVMFVDGDDCISKNLVSFINKNPHSTGWHVGKGYVYQEHSRFIYYKGYAFNRCCGTCQIIKPDLYPLPSKIDDVDEDLLWEIRDHAKIDFGPRTKIDFGPRRRLKKLPFPAVIYNIGNGENDYQTGFKKFFSEGEDKSRSFKSIVKDTFDYRLITKSIRQEFGLYSL